MPNPTDRQREVLRAILAHLEQEGTYPSTRELADRLGIKGLQAIAGHLAALERKGYLTLARGQARAVRLSGVRLRVEYTPDEAGQRLRQAALPPTPPATPGSPPAPAPR